MAHVLYRTTCTTTGEFYIGIHSCDNEEYLGSGVLIREKIKQYGKENFSKQIIAIFESREILQQAETLEVSKHMSNLLCLNLVGGGSVGWYKDSSPEKVALISQKISKSLRNSPLLARGKNSPLSKLSKEKRIQNSIVAHETISRKTGEKWIAFFSKVDWKYVNVEKFGWVQRLADLMGVMPQKVRKIVKRYHPEILHRAFSRRRTTSVSVAHGSPKSGGGVRLPGGPP